MPTLSAGNEANALIDRQRGSCKTALTILRKPFKKTADGDTQRLANLIDHGGTYTVPCVLVFLQLLEGDAYRSGKLSLRHVRQHANRRDLPAYVKICGVRVPPDPCL